jgi:hypothetical protein
LLDDALVISVVGVAKGVDTGIKAGDVGVAAGDDEFVKRTRIARMDSTRDAFHFDIDCFVKER